MKKISEKERREGESVGLWNVNQKLVNYYDDQKSYPDDRF